MLHHVDLKLYEKSHINMASMYVRYSDDILYIGTQYENAMSILEEELNKMSMKLNPKKEEYLTGDKWFKFLGFMIKGIDPIDHLLCYHCYTSLK